ncbi:tellurite resistance protein [Brevundimonas vesicularis]|uniref:Tellurite resistance protein n=1 Tax=Brevundimonas vesicularis TaxID=41276 RepID=A0A7W9FRI8_BREVE|nr:tellurite resistance protein [Brevundimonas vesicularis]
MLGLAGLANAWRAAHRVWGAPSVIAESLFGIATIAWALITVLYALKWLTAPDVARAEAGHPVQCCFIGLAGVATLLIAQGADADAHGLATLLFVAGALFTLGFAVWRTGLLWRGERSQTETTPVLYLPAVAGGFTVGATAAAFHWPDLGHLAFGAALFSWLAIESVLLNRLYTSESLPPALRPTLGIQLAPPAVGASAYLALNPGAPDVFAYALVGYALLQALLLIRMNGWIRQQPFNVSYWAFTFGATALAGASIQLAHDGSVFQTVLGLTVFAATNVLVLSIGLGTLGLLLQGRILPRPPEARPSESAQP